MVSSQAAWVGILAQVQSLTSSVILGKLLNFPVLQFHHVNGDNNVRIDARIKLVNIIKTLYICLCFKQMFICLYAPGQ